MRGEDWTTAKLRLIRLYLSWPPDQRRGEVVDRIFEEELERVNGNNVCTGLLDADATNQVPGYVYLLKHGNRREYKIGRTWNAVRREGEVRIELPEKLESIHYIKTDDPVGVENYWHRRFADKRKEGEWFALTAADVRAFKRWRRIY